MRTRPTRILAFLSGVVLVQTFVFAQAAPASESAPRLTFSKSFPGSVPAYFAITIAPDGTATYNESEDPDNIENIHLESAVAKQAFELADRLDHFKHPLESGLKIANMGLKTLRWQQGAEGSESKYNYSTIEDAKALGDIFERIADSVRMSLELRRALKHDRLGVNDAVLRIQAAWENRRLLATDDILPSLDEIAKNDAYIHMARERAARVADAIRASR
jgi:hypothetical protein